MTYDSVDGLTPERLGQLQSDLDQARDLIAQLEGQIGDIAGAFGDRGRFDRVLRAAGTVGGLRSRLEFATGAAHGKSRIDVLNELYPLDDIESEATA